MVTSQKVPYHMQDDSGDESEAPIKESGSEQGGKDAPANERRASGLKGMLGRKVRIGDVQLDPDIGASEVVMALTQITPTGQSRDRV